MTDNSNIRVVVAMSGGVDSSVAAALLVEQGYDVIGMMMRLWSEQPVKGSVYNRCCTPGQMNDARRIADKLGIPFYVLDTKEIFRNTVVEYFIDQHRQALTPNPCIECNRHIRFTYLLHNALALDADYLATGHYARVDQSPNGQYRLRMSIDQHKDQSYVLSILQQKHLKHVKFPIGEYSKSEVRSLAKRFGLPVASKKDSQDLCFLSDGDYRRFLSQYAPDVMRPGPIMLTNGEVIGEHRGLANYTIGQRRGLGITHSEPLYVITTEPYKNILVVGTKKELGNDTLTAKNVNWITSPPKSPFHAQVKIRYKADTSDATIELNERDHIKIKFKEPLRDITPGQSAVIYHNDICLGGGIIEPPD